ncbi:type II toxin-antitoxin system VapB family antitoxin [Nocardioides sp.]|uniref:type II toxin-antitoxin system VapB family antitoxin n=1 Tax=Nocardioides sp. TaxID=35761 RepID=UPI00351167C9
MSLNIKNERVHALAREAARITGKSQTSVIEEALVRLLADLGDDPAAVQLQHRLDLVDAITLEWQQLPERSGGIRDEHDLYDDTTGLPA